MCKDLESFFFNEKDLYSVELDKDLNKWVIPNRDTDEMIIEVASKNSEPCESKHTAPIFLTHFNKRNSIDPV